MTKYIKDKNRIIDNNGKILIESNNDEQLNNVLSTINDLKAKLEDDYTGSYSRFKLNEDVQSNHAHIVFIDVNYLKRINTKLGHKNGDRLLELVVGNLKKFGNVYRQGGDEFVLLIEEDETLKNFKKENEKTMLFSYGICEKNEYSNSKDGLILADKRMYTHKQNQHTDLKDKNL